MPQGDRILMGPGPSNPYPEVVEALTRPMLGHLDPELISILDRINARLRWLFGTSNQLTFPVSGTGSAGMEAAFVNFVRPGDPVVIGVNGVFGERMCDAAGRCGAEVTRVEAPWGAPVEPQRLLDAHPSPAMIALVHAETSTGVRNDLTGLAAGKGDALLVLDCVTSLGGMPVEIDEWGVDIAYSATQKCLGAPPGLAPFTVNERALERRRDPCPSWYLDLGMIAGYVTGKGARAYHHTAPVSMLFALDAALETIEAEGLSNTWHRHARCGEAIQGGLESFGLELFAEKGHRLSQLTSVRIPADRLSVDEPSARRQLLDRYGIEIGPGLGPVAGEVWRVGSMGHTARPRNGLLLLAALADLFDS